MKLLVFIFLFISEIMFPQSEFGGLYFPGKNVLDYYRSSVELNNDSPLTIEKELSIYFQLSIWNCNYMGLIVSGKSTNFNFQVQFDQYRNKDTAFIILTARQTIISEIPLVKANLIRNQWHSFNLEFNPASSYIKMKLDEVTKFARYSFPLLKDIKIIIGRTKEYSDIPEMAIKDIQLQADDNYYNWKLKYNQADEIHGMSALVENPRWLDNKHYYWERKFSAPLDHFNWAGAVFVPQKDSLYLFSQKHFYRLNILNYHSDSGKYTSGEVHFLNNFIFNFVTKEIYSYYCGAEGDVSVFNNYGWSNVDTSNDKDQHYYVHSYFINPYSGDLMTLGGYGWYKFKNDLRRYDKNKKQWEVIKTSGDYLEPRQLSSHSQEVNGKIYFYGGKGNETGDQHLEAKIYNEVFSLDLRSNKIEKLFKIDGKVWGEDDQYSNNAYFSSIDTSLYLIHRSVKSLHTSISLERISFTDKKMYTVAEEKILKGEYKLLNFFFSDKTKEFFIVVGGHNNFEVYSLFFPPIIKRAEASRSKALLYFSLAGALLLITIFYLINKKRSVKEVSQRPVFENEVIAITTKETAEQPREISGLFLFGSFTIIDQDGKDISILFSPKLKQLFILILIYSQIINGRKGITTEKLTNVLWPDKSPESAKNTRGVTINNLKKLLEKSGGIELYIENGYWKIALRENFFFDYDLYTSEKNKEVISISSRLLEIFNRGEFLKEFDYEWIEPIKLSINNEVLRFLLSALEKEMDTEQRLRVAQAINTIDPFNEQGALAMINSLISTGRLTLAKQKFESFSSNYLEVHGKTYPKTFSELIKH